MVSANRNAENKICQWDEENQQWINCLDAET